MSSTLASLSRLATTGNESYSSTTAVHFPLTVKNDKFHMRLKTSKEKYPVVSGFDKDSDGLPGEVEASGKVVSGDYLKSVNGIRWVSGQVVVVQCNSSPLASLSVGQHHSVIYVSTMSA